MGRRIPCSPEANNVPSFHPVHVPFFHPVLVLSFVVAWIIASIAIITSLCASCHRKRASPKSPSKPPSPTSNDATARAAAEATTVEVSEHLQAPSSPEEEDETREIERMPEVAAEHGPILPTVVLPSSTSKRKLSISLSTKLPQKIKSKREGRQGKAASEDSIWKKTIILGEKCKVPVDVDEEEEDEEMVVCNDEGNRQRVYHPRTPSSVPLSRNTSFASPSEVPS